MNTRAIFVAFGLSALPCLAGYLEDGIKSHERGDYKGAASAFERASTSGSAEARRRLGFMFYHGEGVAQDNQRAVALFERAAEGGDVRSAANLAKMYQHGMGVEQDDKRAADWFRKAAEMGDAPSQFEASIVYYKGQGVERDRPEAAKWWTLAMSGGGRYAEVVRASVQSAEAKLTPEEIAEGKRRAAEWLKDHPARQ
jgi:uncharacterized protein